jgi:uncharacterized protein
VAVLLSNPDHDSERLRAIARAILESTELCAMATLADDGRPHINTAYFAFDGAGDMRLYFLSHPDSLHCRNIARRPEMAVAVFDTRQPWGAPGKGLQLFGTAGLATGEAASRAREAYAERFPMYLEFDKSAAAAPAGPSFHVLRLYEFIPTRLKILDEDQLADGLSVPAEIRRG